MMPTLPTIIRDACEYGPAVEFRNSYSGRGMFGQQCVAIVGHRQSCQQLVATVIQDMSMQLVDNPQLQSQFDQYVEQLMNWDQDSMGFDVVWYWPHLRPIDFE